MASDAQLLRVEKVSRHFSLPGNQSLPVLNEVSFEMGPGETLAITGPSGSGKSTLLQIIGTLDKPSAGRVLLNGQDPAELKEEQLAALRNRQLGFVFQAHYLLPQCSVLENVLVPTLAQFRKAQSKTEQHEPESSPARAKRLLERVGLGQRMQHLPGELSGGERQRAAVVRALINRPSLLLADEPTGSLDHASALQLGHLLAELNREEKVTLIVVTHSAELAEQMSRILELKDGRLVTNRNKE